MAKKEPAKSRSSRPLILILLVLGISGGWWLWKEHTLVDNLKDRLLAYIDNQDILTLESRYTSEQMMDILQPEIIGKEKRTWQEPINKYYPYLLLDVKYTEDQKSREGVLLWSLINGEMVLNTDTWETTHGFKDCLECQANRNDFKILQILAKHQGSAPIEVLQKDLQVERDTLDPWIESVKQKHLVIQKGNLLQLHFENPKILVLPQTYIKQQLVFKPSADAKKEARNYSRTQILAMAKAAFGEDFKVRNEQEVYLPVYGLQVLNQDGSIYNSDWNAITGRRVDSSYFSKR
jgi:hypothetical protein